MSLHRPLSGQKTFRVICPGEIGPDPSCRGSGPAAVTVVFATTCPDTRRSASGPLIWFVAGADDRSALEDGDVIVKSSPCLVEHVRVDCPLRYLAVATARDDGQ